MRAFVVFACVLAVAQATGYAGHGGYATHAIAAPIVAHAKLINTGHSEQSRKQDAAGNYAFAYNEQHGDGGSSRKESGDGWGNKVGSYSLNIADGRQRIVKYVADAHGFRASIATNEPGTAAKPAAATSISSPYAAPEPVLAVAPVVHAPIAVAEPIAYAAPLAKGCLGGACGGCLGGACGGHGGYLGGLDGGHGGYGLADGGHGGHGLAHGFAYNTHVSHVAAPALLVGHGKGYGGHGDGHY